jgi:hypothetical protein
MGNNQAKGRDLTLEMELPETVLLHVLSFVNEKDLLLKCSLVCKTWKRLIDSQTLWRTKCERAGYYSQSLLPSPPEDFKKYYFQNPYNRNLIKNPCALGNFQGLCLYVSVLLSDCSSVVDREGWGVLSGDCIFGG